jgi:hypothetical protein
MWQLLLHAARCSGGYLGTQVLTHRLPPGAGYRSRPAAAAAAAACWSRHGVRSLATSSSAAEGLTVGQLYDGLQLPRGASKGAVKARYFQLAKTVHPDHPGGSNERFGRTTDIYQRLVRIAPVRAPLFGSVAPLMIPLVRSLKSLSNSLELRLCTGCFGCR